MLVMGVSIPGVRRSGFGIRKVSDSPLHPGLTKELSYESGRPGVRKASRRR